MKARVLSEKALEASNEGLQTQRTVYFPTNGAVVQQVVNETGKVLRSEIVVRLVYASDEMTEVLLDTITRHTAGG
jgi:hypothetical protein